MIALLGPIWKWLSTHAAPWIAAFLLGVFWSNAAHEKALRKALEAQDRETAEAIRDTAKAVSGAETQRKADYENLEAVIRRNRAPMGACAPDPAALGRVRLKAEAANEYALGRLRGGTDTP